MVDARRVKSEETKDDQISVVHSRETDSPRTETEVDAEDLARGMRDPDFLSGEKDEGAGLTAEGVVRPVADPDLPLDIQPMGEVSGEYAGVVDHSEQATLGEYERGVSLDSSGSKKSK